jgi:hypothetical protein
MKTELENRTKCKKESAVSSLQHIIFFLSKVATVIFSTYQHPKSGVFKIFAQHF